MNRTIAVASQKGGVGKTTTVANLASWTALLGKRTLAIDLDPQGSLTLCLGQDGESNPLGLEQVLMERLPIDKAIQPTFIQGLDLLPGNLTTAAAERKIMASLREPRQLRAALDLMEKPYDFIFIDTQPGLVGLSNLALAAADSLIVPLQCEFLSLATLARLLDTIGEIRKTDNPWLQLEGILITMYDETASYSQPIVRQAWDQFRHELFETIIPRLPRLSEATVLGRPIVLYDIRSKGSEAYLNLAKELLQRYV